MRKRHAAGGGNPTNPHSYFEQLVASDYHYRSWHLRTQAQIDSLTPQSTTTMTSYVWPNDDFVDKQDAAKIVMPTGFTNYELMNMPLSFSAEQLGAQTATILITWDFYWDRSYADNIGGITTYKAFQIRRAGGSGGSIWYEPKTAHIGVGGKSSWFHIRGYNTAGYPFGVGGTSLSTQTINGKNYPDNITPQLTDFAIEHNTWTRFWLEFGFTAGSTVLTNRMWIADETRDAVQLHSSVTCNLPPVTTGATDGYLHFLQIEFNSSQSRGATAAPWIGYIRNACTLRDAPDSTVFLQRPTR